MADVFGNVTLPLLESEAETLLYTCPLVSGPIDGGTGDKAEDIVTFAQQLVTQTQITSILVCAHTADTYSIWLTPTSTSDPSAQVVLDGGAATTNDYALFKTVAIGLKTTDIISPGIVMSPGQTLWAGATTSLRVTITVNYIEIS
jgi:hypothetical protein